MRPSSPKSLSLGLVLCAASSLASGETLPDAVKRCSVEKDDHTRLSCFDAVAQVLAGPPAPPSPPVKPEDSFGVKGELLRKQREAEKPPEPKIKQVDARIKKASVLPRGQIVVELDNGQVWEQKEVKPSFTVRTDEPVRVEAGSLGAFWLINEAGRRTRVKRVH